jgi:hypothetical protein
MAGREEFVSEMHSADQFEASGRGTQKVLRFRKVKKTLKRKELQIFKTRSGYIHTVYQNAPSPHPRFGTPNGQLIQKF